MSIFNKDNENFLTSTMFLGEELGIQRYEQVKYPVIEKMTEKQLSFFWLPQEVDLSRDPKDFRDLTEHEQHIFTSNLKRQILLDTVQGRSPNLALLPLTTLPELEAWIELWSFNEMIHSRSYSHIIRQIYSDPSKVFDEIMDIQEIVDCSLSVTKYYNELYDMARWYGLLGSGEFTVVDNNTGLSRTVIVDEYNLKKKIWMVLNAVNALEGIRFYVSFACSWAFAELKKMEGNAKIIKLICRDENLHLAFTQTMLKTLPKDDPDYAKIKEETKDECLQLMLEAVDQEKNWAAYLFKDGSMIGLNEQLLNTYIEWIAHKRLTVLGLKSPFNGGSNPLPWTEQWISSAQVQTAPQETQITSYTLGAVDMNIDTDSLGDFEL